MGYGVNGIGVTTNMYTFGVIMYSKGMGMKDKKW